MSNLDGLGRTMRQKHPASRRQMRAARLRARALSPVRIVRLLLSIPILASIVATSLYMRTSPYEPHIALAHLIARFGCDAALSVDLAPAYRGEVGYHARNDEDGNGVTCEYDSQFTAPTTIETASLATAEPVPAVQERMANGAKFVKP